MDILKTNLHHSFLVLQGLPECHLDIFYFANRSGIEDVAEFVVQWETSGPDRFHQEATFFSGQLDELFSLFFVDGERFLANYVLVVFQQELGALEVVRDYIADVNYVYKK